MPLLAATTNTSLIPGSEHIRGPVRLGTILSAAAKELRRMNNWNRSLRVKRPNRIRRDKSGEVYGVDLNLKGHPRQLAIWELISNSIRLHQSLDHLRPYGSKRPRE